MKKEIAITAPSYRGAPMPEFDELAINESKIEDYERYKYVDECNIDTDTKEICIEWLSQESDDYSPSDAFRNEVYRACIANGATDDFILNLKFGSRDCGYVYFYNSYLKDFLS